MSPEPGVDCDCIGCRYGGLPDCECGCTSEEHPSGWCATCPSGCGDYRPKHEAAAAPGLEIEALRSLVADLVDADDCWFDHHGYCQAHGWFETEPACPHARAKALLAAPAVPMTEETPDA